MKKIFAVILVLMLLAVFPLASFAETQIDTPVSDEIASEGNSTPEAESPTEGEISPPTDSAEAPEADPDATFADEIVAYLEANLEEILVVIGTIGMAIYTKLQNTKIGGALGTINANSVAIAQGSEKIALNALEKVAAVTDKLASWEGKITEVLDKLARTEEEKKDLEKTVGAVSSTLAAVKTALVEVSEEVTGMVMFANLPNSVKDEYYSKHLKAISGIKEEGVKSDDGAKA